MIDKNLLLALAASVLLLAHQMVESVKTTIECRDRDKKAKEDAETRREIGEKMLQ